MERYQVNTQALEATAKRMVADGKGLLAIDESTGSCNKTICEVGDFALRLHLLQRSGVNDR
ncbi:MAG TPA: class I fructose-bisphosphate aldolase [Acidobacteriaceae bacterium]|nr:class I fructose-bisphosphate aldolase [Acidobacteriaceae bacterium]